MWCDEVWPDEKPLAILREERGQHVEPRLIDQSESILPRILEVKMAWDAKESAG